MSRNYWSVYEQNRRVAINAMEADDRARQRSDGLRRRSVVMSEANSYLEEEFKKALSIFEGVEFAKSLYALIDDILASQVHPYGKVDRIAKALLSYGIDIHCFYWQLIIEGCKKAVSEMTNPNQFY